MEVRGRCRQMGKQEAKTRQAAIKQSDTSGFMLREAAVSLNQEQRARVLRRSDRERRSALNTQPATTAEQA
jgi:hypothetical protein